jgi:uncharacterized protein YcnI
LRRRLRVGLGVALAVLALPVGAAAHARVSPAVSQAGLLQLYSLAVPTEKSGVRTNKVELTLPKNFSVDSFVPTPGWHRVLQQTGSGDNAVAQTVTWSGGSVPSGEDSLFQFLAQPASAGHYTFLVEQTYSDGSIVNWTGSESSAAPAPTIDVISGAGGGSSSGGGGGGVGVVDIVALLLAGLALAGSALALAGRGQGGRPLT